MNKPPITPEIRDRLHLAIDRARGRGKCKYVIDNAPGCVIGQFGALSNIPIDVLQFGSEEEREFYKRKKYTTTFNGSAVFSRLVFKLQWPEYIFLLLELQKIWDVDGDEEQGRQAMREILNQWPVEDVRHSECAQPETSAG